MEKYKELLCSHQKLERDEGVAILEQLLPVINENGEVDHIHNIVFELLKLLSDPATKSWEGLQGSLNGLKVVIDKEKGFQISLSKFCPEIQEYCVTLLTHDECRVRLAAGELLGALSKKFGIEIYISCKEKILDLIQDNMERHIPSDSNTDSNADFNNDIDDSLYKLRRSSSSEIFHDTAGWKFLETSMKCLQFMIVGCGSQFQEMINQELLDLIFVALKHSNRFVRETGYYVFSALFACVSEANSNAVTEHPVFVRYGSQLNNHLSIGLADNWSQVRLAASEATRKFLMSMQSDELREDYFSLLLPRMCLNRYYVAEGVRLYSQETWKLVTGTEGKELVEKFIKLVVDFYIAETQADNHAVREAACACIAELGSKIRPDVIEPYVEQLLKALLMSFQDDSWPVRDAACLASGNFVKCFPEHSSYCCKLPEGVLTVMVYVVGQHSSNILTNCAFCDKSTKFGTLVEGHIMKRFGYLATTDLASEGCGSHFTKWWPGDIKMAIASTFVERFHRLWGLWMRLTEYYKRMGLNV
ncbi:hypothetical protein GQR58_028719 [Nymphon striatum]|nr:hypothetical protein GQR58_028719 [Nymphon striatum]